MRCLSLKTQSKSVSDVLLKMLATLLNMMITLRWCKIMASQTSPSNGKHTGNMANDQ